MSIQVVGDEEELIGEDERPRYGFIISDLCFLYMKILTILSRFKKVPTLPAAILQIVLCAIQIGSHVIQTCQAKNVF